MFLFPSSAPVRGRIVGRGWPLMVIPLPVSITKEFVTNWKHLHFPICQCCHFCLQEATLKEQGMKSHGCEECLIRTPQVVSTVRKLKTKPNIHIFYVERINMVCDWCRPSALNVVCDWSISSRSCGESTSVQQ